ncbi:MAG: penicillin acylase family protein [Actinobacteria bacterium]|nr:penicillin acylase family protein [Actinomycetota bacterium]
MRRDLAVLGLLALALAATTAIATLPAVGQNVPEHLDPAFHELIDDALLHGTVTPPGAEITEKDSERVAYDELAYGYPALTEEQLTGTYFKDGRFGPVDAARTYSPRADVTIVRDARWGVPHIYGETDAAMAFGAGYASAEDRLPIMELLRALGRAEAFELLEHNAAWLADAELVRAYGYTEKEFQAMIDRLPELYGQDGQDVVTLLEAHAAGINHFILQMQEGRVDAPVGLADLLPPNTVAPWRPTDIVAVVSIVRALFGADGGNELANAARFAELTEAYGADQARAVYEDFRNRHNLDGPLHTTEPSFTFMQTDLALPGTDGNVSGFSSGAPGPVGIIEELGSLFPGGQAQAAAQLGALAEAARIRWERVALETAGGADRRAAPGAHAGRDSPSGESLETAGGADRRAAPGAHAGRDSPSGESLENDHLAVDLSRAAEASMSNWLLVGGEHTTTGFPIVLGGPQAAYFDPQILVEAELHSPTIHARGAGFPGLSTLVVIGRSHEAAWTATAGGSDMIDTYIEVLCDPDGDAPTEEEVHYLHDTDGDGEPECVPMDVRLHREATTLPGGELLPAIYAERTVHGPVTARGTLGDTPVAVSRKRSTYLKELDPAISILKMNRGEADTAEDFIAAFADHNLSTNWAFADRDDIGYVHGGLYPRRPNTIHPDLPVWGTGAWEWEPAGAGEEGRGTDDYHSIDEHPHEANPDRGFAVSWNNRTAPGWGEDDSGWGFSSVYRSDLLEDQLEAAVARGEKISPVTLVQMMERAGLTDLRATHDLPLLLRVLSSTDAPSQRAAQMRDLLAEWIDPAANPAGVGLRRDGDRDGDYDRGAAVAIMDAWWEPLIHAMYDPALRQPVDEVSRQDLHNAPSFGGSAFAGGFYGQVWTDLAMVLGDEVASPTSQVYCGASALGTDGTLESCATALWASLEQAGAALAADQGDDPAAWQADAAGERIQFIPPTSGSMHWVNRPTTQVLAMFGADAPPAPSAPRPAAPPAPPAPLPTTGGGLAAFGALTLLGAALLGAALVRRPGRHRPRVRCVETWPHR